MFSDITKIKIRQDTKENWTNVNPILEEGEIAYELPSTQFIDGAIKVGDGKRA